MASSTRADLCDTLTKLTDLKVKYFSRHWRDLGVNVRRLLKVESPVPEGDLIAVLAHAQELYETLSSTSTSTITSGLFDPKCPFDRIFSLLDAIGQRRGDTTWRLSSGQHVSDDWDDVKVKVECKKKKEKVQEEVHRSSLKFKCMFHGFWIEATDLDRSLFVNANWIESINASEQWDTYKIPYLEQSVAVRVFRQHVTTSEALNKSLRRVVRKPHEHVLSLLGMTGYYRDFGLVMKYVPTTLATLIKKQTLNTKEFHTLMIPLLIQVAKALSHYQQILNGSHNDVFPDNIYVDEKKGVYNFFLGPFDVAPHLTREQSYFSYIDTAPFHCSAPEVVESRKYGVSSDIFQFGITMFFCLHGKFPASRNLTFAANRFSQLMKQCLESDPEKRPTIQGLIDSLQSCTIKPLVD